MYLYLLILILSVKDYSFMFYFLEVFDRAKYIFFSLVLLLFICFFFKDYLLYIFLYSIIIRSNAHILNVFEIDNFIYTHPVEILSMYVLLTFYFSFIFFLPLFFWQILDFLKSSFYVHEYKGLKLYSLCLYIFLFFFNFIGLFYIFPFFWLIIDGFNTSLFFIMLFELKVHDFILFVLYFLFYLNFFILIFLIFLFFFKIVGIKFFINWKKLFVFLNIVFATLFSPPDISMQLILFILFCFIFEFISFFYLFSLKNLKILVR